MGVSDFKRDTRTGKFAPGGKGGPGRKPVAYEKKYLEAFKKAVSEEDWVEIIEKAVEDAKEGDSVAREFLAKYLVGPPPQRLEIDDESSYSGPALILLPDRLAGMVDDREGVVTITKEIKPRKRRASNE